MGFLVRMFASVIESIRRRRRFARRERQIRFLKGSFPGARPGGGPRPAAASDANGGDGEHRPSERRPEGPPSPFLAVARP